MQWTYTPTVVNGATNNPIAGATVSTRDAGGRQSSCTTNSSGQCVLELRQEVVSSPAGDATLTTRNENPTALTIAAPGCTSLNFDLIISQTTTQTQTLICRWERDCQLPLMSVTDRFRVPNRLGLLFHVIEMEAVAFPISKMCGTWIL